MVEILVNIQTRHGRRFTDFFIIAYRIPMQDRWRFSLQNRKHLWMWAISIRVDWRRPHPESGSP